MVRCAAVCADVFWITQLNKDCCKQWGKANKAHWGERLDGDTATPTQGEVSGWPAGHRTMYGVKST